MHTVIGANGEERQTTLRDARRMGLLPSVTNVLGILAKEGLTNWRIESAILSALTLPRKEGEPLDAFARRVVEDAESKRNEAAAFGIALHHGAQMVANSPLDVTDQKDPLFPWLKPYKDWYMSVCVRPIFAERILTMPAFGIAGTADLCFVHKEHGLVLVDIKTQGFGARGYRVYSTWLYQLAAYAKMLGTPCRVMNVIVDSDRPGGPLEHRWSEEEVERGWDVFKAALGIWRAEKRYDPSGGMGAAKAAAIGAAINVEPVKV